MACSLLVSMKLIIHVYLSQSWWPIKWCLSASHLEMLTTLLAWSATVQHIGIQATRNQWIQITLKKTRLLDGARRNRSPLNQIPVLLPQLSVILHNNKFINFMLLQFDAHRYQCMPFNLSNGCHCNAFFRCFNLDIS